MVKYETLTRELESQREALSSDCKILLADAVVVFVFYTKQMFLFFSRIALSWERPSFLFLGRQGRQLMRKCRRVGFRGGNVEKGSRRKKLKKADDIN